MQRHRRAIRGIHGKILLIFGLAATLAVLATAPAGAAMTQLAVSAARSADADYVEDVTGAIVATPEAGTLHLEIGETSTFELAVLPQEESPPVIGLPSPRTGEEIPPQN